MSNPTHLIEELQRRTEADGFAAPIERRWDANTSAAEHTHEFDADAVITEGEMWLTRAGGTQHLQPGGTFRLARGEPHSERYGSAGAVYWVARRQS